MRAAYNYVSTWWAEWTGQYLLFAALAFLGLWRIRATRDHWIVLGGLVALGLMSVPVSWLLLDYQKLSVIPQIQPARALLFVTAIAVLVSGAAGCLAANAKRWIEASAWFFFALWVPVDSTFFGWHGWRVALVVLAFALLLAASRHWMRVGVALLLAPAMAIPAGVVTHRNVETPDLAALADWARSATPSNAIFAFPDSVRDRSPGWFRSRALRPVFVDWKSGGQVNYLREFGYEWWRRWQAIMEEPKPLPQYRTFGIDFVVTRRRLNGSTPPAYSNPHFFAYRVPTP
jgi:hypothetical protein